MTPIRILIVDQYPIVREALKAVLSPEPDIHVVGETYSVDSICDLITEHRPDVILMGFFTNNPFSAAAINAATECKYAAPFVIFVSVEDGDTLMVQQAVQNPNIKGVLPADIEPGEIKTVVHRVARGETYVDSRIIDKVFDRAAERRDFSISLRQLQIIQMIADGFTNKRISAELGISPDTVKTHIRIVLKKLNAADRAQAVAIAYQQGILNKPANMSSEYSTR